MSFVFGLLGAFIGIILAVLTIVFIILKIIQKKLHIEGLNPITALKREANMARALDLMRPKSVNGMTTLLEPQILKDFPDFNKEMIYSLIESNLRTIFKELQTLEIENKPELEVINESIKKEIEDIKSQNIEVKYTDVKFYRHALKRYERKNGIATVTTSSSLSFKYYDPRMKELSGCKVQTRYTCKYIYIYDLKKIPNNAATPIFVFRCPNCGAPLKKLENAFCEYCGSHIEEINLKTWRMASYKDDYEEVDKD